MRRSPRTAASRNRPPAASRGRPRTAGLREAILAEAERVFGERAFHRARMDDVARGAGVGKGTLYRYFESKEALHRAVLLEGVDRLEQELRAVLAEPIAPVRKLHRMAGLFLAHFARRRVFFAELQLAGGRRPSARLRGFRRRREDLVRPLEQAVEEAVRAGELRPVRPRIAAAMLFGMLREAGPRSSGRAALEVGEDEVMETFLDGVGARAVARRRAP